MEYTGDGIQYLSVTDRATICNMGAELGATTSVFPSDDVTLKFLEAQGRAEAYRELSADADCTYDRTITIDLDELEPLAAAPHSPDNIKRITALAGMNVPRVRSGAAFVRNNGAGFCPPLAVGAFVWPLPTRPFGGEAISVPSLSVGCFEAQRHCLLCPAASFDCPAPCNASTSVSVRIKNCSKGSPPRPRHWPGFWRSSRSGIENCMVLIIFIIKYF